MPKPKRTSYASGQRYAPYPSKKARVYNPPVRSFAPTSRASLMMPETKYFDTGINASVTFAGTTWADSEVPCDNYVNSSGTPAAYTDSALIPSAVGSGYGQVNGNRYKLKKIRVRGAVTKATGSDQADALRSPQVRIMLIMDTQPNGTQAQGEDVMQDFGATQEQIYAFKRVASNSGRFRILKDKFVVIKPTNSQTDGTNTGSIAFDAVPFSFQYQPKTPIQVNIASGNSTPTVAGLQSCNIFMMVVGAISSGAQTIEVVACSRAYYCD